MSKNKLFALAFLVILAAQSAHGLYFVGKVNASVREPQILLESPKNGSYPETFKVDLNDFHNITGYGFVLKIFAVSSDAPENVDLLNTTYYIDGVQKAEEHSFLPIHSYYGMLITVPKGVHTIRATAYAQTYKSNGTGREYSPVVGFDSGEIVIIAEGEPSGIPPSIYVNPTKMPTSTPKQPSGFLGTSSIEYMYAIAVVLVIATVAAFGLFYLEKLRDRYQQKP